MYIALCDDQIEELTSLTILLEKWQRQRGAMLKYKTFHNAVDMIHTAEKECFTLYLLDVMMPGMDGLTAAKEIRQLDTTADIIFLTHSPEFAYESYQVHALNYLLKPVSSELLYPLLDQLMQREQKPREGLTLKCGSSLIRVLFSQLTYVEINGKHLYFHLTDNTEHEIFGTLKEYEGILLERPEFMKIHRSYIVNMLQVARLSPTGVRTFSGKDLPVSRLLYSQLQKEYIQLMFTRTEGC